MADAPEHASRNVLLCCCLFSPGDCRLCVGLTAEKLLKRCECQPEYSKDCGRADGSWVYFVATQQPAQEICKDPARMRRSLACGFVTAQLKLIYMVQIGTSGKGYLWRTSTPPRCSAAEDIAKSPTAALSPHNNWRSCA